MKKQNNILAIMLVVGLVALGGTYLLGMWEMPFSLQDSDEGSSGTLPSTGTGHALVDNFTVLVFNAEDKDATYGASDVYGKIWLPGTTDWTGEYVESTTTFAATTGKLTFEGDSILTGQTYDLVAYQGDGGTNLYPETMTLTIPNLDAEIDEYTWPDKLYLYTEGSFSESACDSATAGFDEANTTADYVELNKTLETVQGTLSWDCTLGQGTSGGVLKDVVLIVREDPANVLSDINDIEHVYMSVKTGGSGLSIPGGDLVSEFRAGAPISIGTPLFRSSANAVITVKFSLPAAEANVGTGNFQLIYDDLGDYRAKADVFGTSDYDVHAAAEITTFRITT